MIKLRQSGHSLEAVALGDHHQKSSLTIRPHLLAPEKQEGRSPGTRASQDTCGPSRTSFLTVEPGAASESWPPSLVREAAES